MKHVQLKKQSLSSNVSEIANHRKTNSKDFYLRSPKLMIGYPITTEQDILLYYNYWLTKEYQYIESYRKLPYQERKKAQNCMLAGTDGKIPYTDNKIRIWYRLLMGRMLSAEAYLRSDEKRKERWQNQEKLKKQQSSKQPKEPKQTLLARVVNFLRSPFEKTTEEEQLGSVRLLKDEIGTD